MSIFELVFEQSERELAAAHGWPALVDGAECPYCARNITPCPVCNSRAYASGLEEQLAKAHEALGQAIAAMDAAWELADCYKVIGADEWEPNTIVSRARSEELLTAFDVAIVAARAALA